MKFDYFRPASLSEAHALLAMYGPRAQVIAGGTDLVVKMKAGVLLPSHLVDITGIDDLRPIRPDDDGNLVIGPVATLDELGRDAFVKEKWPVLGEAAAQVGSRQVRNLATIGGNLCNASPAADMIPSLLALGASLTVVGRGGQREIALEDFFLGPGQTVLRENELLSAIKVPPTAPGTGLAYLKLSVRRAMDTALVGSAALVRLDEAGRCLDCRIALGAVAATPIRVYDAGQVLVGSPFTPELLVQAGILAGEASRPVTDLRASAGYRREMVPHVTRRAVLAAWERARGAWA